jgi:eukaryotic-like serine/threonine-protein kinase
VLRDKLAKIATEYALHSDARDALEDLIQLALVDSFRVTAVPIVKQAPPDNANRPPETRVIGSEELEDLGPIGRGGMAEVRRVRDPALNRIMAMKVIHEPLLKQQEWIARFIEEAQATAQLQHPNIVPIHRIGQLPDGRHYFTMPEIRGRTLREVLKRHFDGSEDWTTRGLVSAFRQVCDAVAYAHARGVVHRDLKPANIMLGSYGEVFVLDWGIAKIMGAIDHKETPIVTERSRTASHHTQFGIVAGTPSYMPPEQATVGVRDVDQRADVYALGAILYEIMTGRPPFDGDDEDEVLEQVRTLSPPKPNGPDALVKICLKAMARDPSDRYPDAEPLASEIGSWLDGARQRETALQLVQQADAAQATGMTLGAQAAGLRIRAEATLAMVPETADESHKSQAWALLDKADDLSSQAHRSEFEREQILNAAFTHCPDLPEAHAALAELHHRRHQMAEITGDRNAASRAELLLKEHTQALPLKSLVRRNLTAYLKGDGALTLITDPPGARVTLHRYQTRNRRLVATPLCSLGRTPLHRVPVPMGNYACRIEAPGRSVVWYPIDIARLEHWQSVAPGDPEPRILKLPASDELETDSCFVPAGWFLSGKNRQKVWVDDTIVKRASVTNAEYLVFLNSLSSNGRLEDAKRFAPRERSGSAEKSGGMIYGLHNGTFALQPDSDGDLWQPNWPVLMVDWYSAQAYTQWISERTGLPWRLGTEFEWEKAARGVDGRLYPWGDHFDPSWTCTLEGHTGPPLPCSVGDFGADKSPYGVVGMAGNAQDWCLGSPNAADLAPRPILGGSWGRVQVPLWIRGRLHPGSLDENTGFRLFRTP